MCSSVFCAKDVGVDVETPSRQTNSPGSHSQTSISPSLPTNTHKILNTTPSATPSPLSGGRSIGVDEKRVNAGMQEGNIEKQQTKVCVSPSPPIFSTFFTKKRKTRGAGEAMPKFARDREGVILDDDDVPISLPDLGQEPAPIHPPCSQGKETRHQFTVNGSQVFLENPEISFTMSERKSAKNIENHLKKSAYLYNKVL